MNRRDLFGLVLTLIGLTGCSASIIQHATPSVAVANVNRPGTSGSNLYVVDLAAVTVYKQGSGSVLRAYTHLSPTAIAFDSSGNLYVANAPAGQNGDVIVYRAGTTTPLYTISTGINNPRVLAFDAAGNLYVANSYFRVVAYAPGGKSPTHFFKVFFPTAIGFDSSQNIYIATAPSPYGHGTGKVLVYAPNFKWLRTIVDDLNNPVALALSRTDDLFIANYSGNNVTVYAPGKSSVLRTISQGVKGPYSLAFDASSDLYVANNRASTVTVYPPGRSTLLLTIHKGVSNPDALTLNASSLFVANASNVTVYPLGGNVPSQTIVKGVRSPIALGIGP